MNAGMDIDDGFNGDDDVNGGGGPQQWAGGGGGGHQQPPRGGGGNDDGGAQQQQPRPPELKPRVPIRHGNLRITATSPRAQEFQQLFDRLNDDSRFTTLESLITNPTANYRRKILVLRIVSITLAGQNTTMNRGANGTRRGGNVTTTTCTRIIRVWCPKSPACSNTAVIFEGNSHAKNFFLRDPMTRDNGRISEMLSFVANAWFLMCNCHVPHQCSVPLCLF